VSADDSNWTVSFHFGTPFGGYLFGFAQPQASVVCPAGLANPNALRTGFYGSGPYELVSTTLDQNIVLRLRPDWTWGPVINGKQLTAANLPQKETWKVISDFSTQANELVTGDLSASWIIGSDVTRLEGDHGLTTFRDTNSIPIMLLFNENPGHPTDDQTLRQALMTAVNVNDVNTAANQGGTPLTGFTVPGGTCYDPNTQALYPTGGIDKAKQILTQAGYKGVGGNLTAPNGTPVKINVLDTGELGNGMQVIYNEFHQLDASATMSAPGANLAGQALLKGQYDVSLGAGSTGGGDQFYFVMSIYSGPTAAQGGNNQWGPSPSSQPEYTTLAENALHSTDCQPRFQMQEYVLQHYLYMPLIATTEYSFGVKGLTFLSGGYWPAGGAPIHILTKPLS
jgi:peptide/nickel transport system substrate-binding protein